MLSSGKVCTDLLASPSLKLFGPFGIQKLDGEGQIEILFLLIRKRRNFKKNRLNYSVAVGFGVSVCVCSICLALGSSCFPYFLYFIQ